MSVRKRGKRYEVRWTEGGRKRSRSFVRARDADAFDLDVRRRRQLGPLAAGVLQSKQTLGQFMEDEWWPRYAIPNLAADTRRRYLEVWGTHLLPRVGDYELRAFTPMLVEDLDGDMARAGVSAASRRKALMLLQGILRRAVSRGLLPVNPVQAVPKPKQPATRRPEPLSPVTVEAIRSRLRQRDAMLVSLLAYAGLRPSEDRGLTWGDVQGRSLHVVASKTGRARTVDLLAPLSQDLAEWRLAQGRPANRELIVPRPSGGAWTRGDWANWRRRIYRPAAKAAGVTGDMRPYRLRGSFVSLLLWEGRSLAYVSEQAGHSIATLARHYAGVVRELEDAPRVAAADAIRQARDVVAGRTRDASAVGS